MGIVSSIEEWSFPSDEEFTILAFDDSTNHRAAEFKNKTLSCLTDELLDSNGCAFAKINGNEGYIYCKSLMLRPIDSWTEIQNIKNHFVKYKAQLSWLDVEDYRVLVHLKYRSFLGTGKILLSDRSNQQAMMECLIPQNTVKENILKNENMIFELELSEDGIRNFFYNSSKRSLVNAKMPSWVYNRNRVAIS